MGTHTLMPLNQPATSWRPVAPALCLALVQAGRRKTCTSRCPDHRARRQTEHGGHVDVAAVALRAAVRDSRPEDDANTVATCDRHKSNGAVPERSAS